MDFFAFKESIARRKSEAASPAAPQRTTLTVAQLTGQIDRALKGAFPAAIPVRGEVSNFHNHSGSGHLYFTLKDPEACIDCVMFRSDAARLKFAPRDGMELLATGRVGVYGQRGRYQFYVTRLEPLGEGALELAFRQMRAKLEAEGLFEQARKRPIPAYPQRIALVTSIHTAAIQDMLKVLRRFPWIQLLVCDVPVQGGGAAEQIAAGLETLNQNAQALGGIDAILLGRGGGSLEDLWPFNEERVARAVVVSQIPVITGIGHEIDVSIADLAADHHAHTPTEAAQVATANWRSAAERTDSAAAHLRREMRGMLNEAGLRLAHAKRHEAFRRPMDRVNRLRQQIDDRQRALHWAGSGRLRALRDRLRTLANRLEEHRPSQQIVHVRRQVAESREALVSAMVGRLRKQRIELSDLAAQLRERHPRHRIAFERHRLMSIGRVLSQAVDSMQRSHRRNLLSLASHLNAVGPQQVLNRGYSITMLKKDDVVVRRADQVRPGDRLITHLADGTIESVAEDQKQLKLFE